MSPLYSFHEALLTESTEGFSSSSFRLHITLRTGHRKPLLRNPVGCRQVRDPERAGRRPDSRVARCLKRNRCPIVFQSSRRPPAELPQAHLQGMQRAPRRRADQAVLCKWEDPWSGRRIHTGSGEPRDQGRRAPAPGALQGRRQHTPETRPAGGAGRHNQLRRGDVRLLAREPSSVR